jgi:hypothetical protein
MSRPSFQFYHGDWISNAKLRRCTHEEKGAWIDVLCLMADGDEFGVLRWPLKEIAQAVGCKVAVLHALVRKGVMKGADPGELCDAYIYTPRSGRRTLEPVTLIEVQEGPIWFSSKQVRDEHIARRRAAGGQPDGRGVAAPKPALDASPKPPFGESPKAGQGARPPTPTPSPSPAPPEKQALSQPPEHPEPPGATRRGTVCALLREKGVDVTPGNPLLLGWVESGATDSQLVEAVERARQHKPPPDRIPAAYLDPIVREVIAGPPAGTTGSGKPAEPAWWSSERATIAKGQSVGCVARPGEDMATYRQRVREAIAKQSGEAA